MFNKPVVLKFYNTIRGVEKTMPIVPAKRLSYDWKKTAAQDFNQARTNSPGQTVRNIVNCTGINTLHRQGWVIRAWQDFYIKPQGIDGFTWRSPMDQKPMNDEDYIGFHGPDRLKYFKNWPKHSLRCLVKVHTGWRVKVPPGYILYQVPMFYQDENRFTACAGSYTADVGVAYLNVPLYWHAVDSDETVAAGTPLCHLILAPDTDYGFEILDEPDQEQETLFKIMTGSRFVRDYGSIKDFYNKLR